METERRENIYVFSSTADVFQKYYFVKKEEINRINEEMERTFVPRTGDNDIEIQKASKLDFMLCEYLHSKKLP